MNQVNSGNIYIYYVIVHEYRATTHTYSNKQSNNFKSKHKSLKRKKIKKETNLLSTENI